MSVRHAEERGVASTTRLCAMQPLRLRAWSSDEPYRFRVLILTNALWVLNSLGTPLISRKGRDSFGTPVISWTVLRPRCL